MTRTLIVHSIVLALFAALLIPGVAFAQTAPASCKGTGIFDNPLNACSIMDLLLSVLRGVVRIAGIFLVLAFVFIGFQFAAAQGSGEAIEKARRNLTWTVIGAAILLGAEGIAAVIEATGRSLTP